MGKIRTLLGCLTLQKALLVTEGYTINKIPNIPQCTLSVHFHLPHPQATSRFYLAAVEKIWEWPGDEATLPPRPVYQTLLSIFRGSGSETGGGRVVTSCSAAASLISCRRGGGSRCLTCLRECTVLEKLRIA